MALRISYIAQFAHAGASSLTRVIYTRIALLGLSRNGNPKLASSRRARRAAAKLDHLIGLADDLRGAVEESRKTNSGSRRATHLLVG